MTSTTNTEDIDEVKTEYARDMKMYNSEAS